jgi:hypothetical protein
MDVGWHALTVSAGDYVVFIVLDPAFGDRIIEIGRRNDIWVAPSDVNRDAMDRLRKLVENEPNPPLISMWSTPRTGATEVEWLGILATIEMHHGEYAHDPAVTRLWIIGVLPEEHVVTALRAYGYLKIELETEGFSAARNEPPT